MVSEPRYQTCCCTQRTLSYSVKVQIIAKTGHYPSMSQAHVHVAKKFIFSLILWQFMMWSYHMLHVYQVAKDCQMSGALQFTFKALTFQYCSFFLSFSNLINAPVSWYFCPCQLSVSCSRIATPSMIQSLKEIFLTASAGTLSKNSWEGRE